MTPAADSSGPAPAPPGTPAAAPEMVAKVIELCEATEFEEPHLRSQVESIRGRLEQPLRIAVAGRVSAGKSTTVNALLASPLAPTGAGETTKIVHYFRRSEVESIEVELRSGETLRSFLAVDGTLPKELPAPVEEIRRIVVSIPYAPKMLDDLHVIDTPGISSVEPDASGRTSELLFSVDSKQAVAEADGLVFLLKGNQDEAEAIAAFAELSTGSRACSVNAIGIVSRADQTGDPVDPMGAAWRMADRLAAEPVLRTRVARVIPLVALLAESLVTGRYAPEDERSLRRLATLEVGDLLEDEEEFVELECDMSVEERRRLLDRLGFYGVSKAVAHLQAGGDPGELGAVLFEASGFPTFEGVIRDVFVARSDVLKADVGLTALERLSFQAPPASGRELRSGIEALRLQPRMHTLNEIAAVTRLGQEEVRLPDWLEEDLLRIAREDEVAGKLGLPSDADLAEIRERAREGATRSHAFVARAKNSTERELAETARTSYTLILRDVAGAADGAEAQEPTEVGPHHTPSTYSAEPPAAKPDEPPAEASAAAVQADAAEDVEPGDGRRRRRFGLGRRSPDRPDSR